MQGSKVIEYTCQKVHSGDGKNSLERREIGGQEAIE